MTSRFATWRSPLLCTLATALALSVVIEGQVSSAQSDERSVRLLNDVAANRRLLNPEQLQELLRWGLSSPEPSERLAAVYAVASRSGGVRFDRSSASVARWHAERPSVQAVRNDVVQLLTDPSARVRRGAIIALGNLDFHIDDHSAGVRLDAATRNQFATLFRSDQSGLVRAEIVKTFAFANDSSARDDILIEALSDADERVKGYAIFGAGERKVEGAFSTLVTLLGHDKRQYRLAAIRALVKNPSRARRFRADIESVLAQTPDPELKGAASVLLQSLDSNKDP